MKKLVVCLAGFFLVIGVTAAAEPPVQLKPGDNTVSLLNRYRNHAVVLRLQSGEEIGGVVKNVGNHMVHIEKVYDRDFYDAAIRIDAIHSVLVRVRDR